MNNTSEPVFEKYVDLDFADAKPVADTLPLAKLQAIKRLTLADVIRETIRDELHRA